MAVPPAPPLLQELGQRPFRFYPALVNCEHDQWRYRRATWSELVVENTRTLQEVALSRAYLGEISDPDGTEVVVRLLKKLEYRDGAVRPAQRRVLEMPRRSDHISARTSGRAPVIGIRLASERAPSRPARWAAGGVALAMAACVLAVSFHRGGVLAAQRANIHPQSEFDPSVFDERDDYASVVRRLGVPADDQWQGGNRGPRFRVLHYVDKGISIVLMAGGNQPAHYAGALDRHGRLLHAAGIFDNAMDASVLRTADLF